MLMIRKWFVGLSGLLLVAVGHSASAKPSIAVVLSTLNNPFFVSMQQGAQQAAERLGYQLIVLDSQNNPAKELANVQDLTVRGDIKVLLLNPADSDASSSAVKLANQASIPVITLDRNTASGEIVSYIASSNVLGGEMAGHYIAEQLGTHAKVIQLEGIPGVLSARERAQGFQRAVAQQPLQLLASQPAYYDRTKGLNVMQNLLTTYPNVQAVFAQNDEMALGAVRALQLAGKKQVLVVGFDGTEEGKRAVKKGDMAATIAQQPEVIGKLGVEMADQLLRGQTVPKVVEVELQLFSK